MRPSPAPSRADLEIGAYLENRFKQKFEAWRIRSNTLRFKAPLQIEHRKWILSEVIFSKVKISRKKTREIVEDRENGDMRIQIVRVYLKQPDFVVEIVKKASYNLIGTLIILERSCQEQNPRQLSTRKMVYITGVFNQKIR